eukprot:s1158_g2.t1
MRSIKALRKEPPADVPRPSKNEGEILSKRQQKKQVLRDARSERKGMKKAQKQVESLNAALKSLTELLERHLDEAAEAAPSLERCLRGVFGDATSYHSLKLSHGPCPDRGLPMLASSLIRPVKYNAKFLPQEYSLLHKIWAMLGGEVQNAGVLDIGAGNANCAMLAAGLMKLTVICVERESPRMELRAEELLPSTSSPSQGRVIRVESDIADFDLASLTEVAEKYGLTKFVLVAKHPCGIGVDRSIDCAVKLHESGGEIPGHPELCGVVLATCCSNKLSLDDFRESRVQEFCQLNQQEVNAGSSSLVKAVEVMSKCSAWRSASQSLGNAITDEQLSWAEIFEDHLQTPRLSKLRRCFGAATEVRFAPRECTLQDRCLLAMKPPFPSNLLAHHDDDPKFFAALEQGVQELLSAAGGPIDCRPKGLKSAKYDFDYSED